MGVELGLMTISDKSIDLMLVSPNLPVNVFRGQPISSGPCDDLGTEQTENVATAPMLELAEEVGVFRILDKAWYVIDPLLTETEGAREQRLGFLGAGGHRIDEIYGIGPGRAIDSSGVLNIDEVVRRTAEPFLQSRFDAQRMLELAMHPADWDRHRTSIDDTIHQCSRAFEKLKYVVEDAVASRRGLLIFEC